MKGWLKIALAVAGVFLWGHASAQYYTWGTDRPMKWMQVRTPSFSLIYPDSAHHIAARTMLYVDRVQHDIRFGFRHGAMPRMPFVMHGENFESNGLVMYMPRRVEFLTIPSEDNYSTLWLKQLVAHEYRHTVQYNNLNRGVFRALSYLTGQHAPTVSLLCMPAWAMEGDAVMSETAMSTYGRGLQPSFTMGYRAMIDRVGCDHRGRRAKNIDRWFCGSYRDFIPDHYALGYQICTYAYTRYGENIWDKVADYGARRPYVIATIHRALRKYYQTDVKHLFTETFADLKRHWDALPEVEDGAHRLVALPDGNYTSYQWPMERDSVRIVAVKSDFDRPTRFVEVDRLSGRERVISDVGRLSSRPAMADGRIWWTEYRRSALYEERVNSVLCYLDLKDGKPHTEGRLKNVRYATPAEERLGWVEYRADGVYRLVTVDAESFGNRREVAFPVGCEVHGLAWDNRSRGWYALLTDDDGMRIVAVGERGVRSLTRSAYVTLSDLCARDGQLYFGSIASGRDEVHRLDLASLKEYRISTSKYGGFDPAPSSKGVLMTAYDARGYALAEHALDREEELAWRPTPDNGINPRRKFWEVVNLDKVRFVEADSLRQFEKHRPRRYRKGLNLFKVHGWLPVGFDPFEAVDEHKVDLNWGVTVLSQNLLSSAEAFASYGWNRDEGSLWKAGLRYYGLGLAWEGRFSYGGDQIVLRLADRSEEGEKLQPLPSMDKYRSVDLIASLPLLFERGAWIRQLVLSAGWNYANTKVADLSAVRWDAEGHIENLDRIGYNNGVHKLAFGVAYGVQCRMAYRDLRPRWGWSVRASYSLNPTNREYSDLISFYTQGYLPGVAAHHSLRIAAHYQTAIGGFRMPSGGRPLCFVSSWLVPRGYSSSAIRPEDYRAASLDYELALWCPEGGIPSVLYVKRIRLSVGGDFGRYSIPFVGGKTHRDLWSLGGELIFDFNVLRQPSSAMATFRFGVWKPKDRGVWVSGSLGLPF